MIKFENNIKKSIKNLIFSGTNVIIIILFISAVSGCLDLKPEPITGAYSDGAKETLDLYDNSTFLFTLHVGYIAGRPVNQSSTGTFLEDGDVVTFTGTNGVTTLGRVQNGAILIEGTKFTKTEK